MKKTLLATVALGLCLTAAITGCDGDESKEPEESTAIDESKEPDESTAIDEPLELNDENFVDFMMELEQVRNEMAEIFPEGGSNLIGYECWDKFEQAMDYLLEKYGWSHEEHERYFVKVTTDEARFERLIEIAKNKGEPEDAIWDISEFLHLYWYK